MQIEETMTMVSLRVCTSLHICLCREQKLQLTKIILWCNHVDLTILTIIVGSYTSPVTTYKGNCHTQSPSRDFGRILVIGGVVWYFKCSMCENSKMMTGVSCWCWTKWYKQAKRAKKFHVFTFRYFMYIIFMYIIFTYINFIVIFRIKWCENIS